MKIVLSLILLAIPLRAMAQTPFVVKDIAVSQDFSYGLAETEFAVVNGILFFVVKTGKEGEELWKYDGENASLGQRYFPRHLL